LRGGPSVLAETHEKAKECRVADLKPVAYPGRADDGLRTRDLQLGKLALYQLSYVRVRYGF
jgi:hypothetical protein